MKFLIDAHLPPMAETRVVVTKDTDFYYSIFCMGGRGNRFWFELAK